jgi:hypothetical protein
MDDKCYERFDNDDRCRRNAKQLNGRCGKCHGITDEWKHCTKPATNGKYCWMNHKTRDEIAEHKAIQRRRSRSRTRSSARSRSRGRSSNSVASYSDWQSSYGSTSQTSSRTARRPGGTPQRSQQKRSRANRGGISKKAAGKPVSGRPLSVAAKREAATLCADIIVEQNVMTAFQSQITDMVGGKLVDQLSSKWDGKQCETIAKLARGLLGVKGYIDKTMKIVLNWLLAKAGVGDTARFFACQLVVMVPVPWNAKLISAARILQVTGICLCFSNGRLMECQCLHDLVRFEGKQTISILMTGAIHNWREIAERVPEVRADVSK